MRPHERAALDRHLNSLRLDKETPPELFHKGQLEAWNTNKRFVLIVAGTQSGKTTAGVHLFLREIARTAKPGDNDYLIVGPNTELLKKKALPEFGKLTKGLADYKSTDKCYLFTPKGARRLTGHDCTIRVFVGYAHDPDSLEAATYKAIWADEAGQETFYKESWEALQRRAAVNKARVFFTSTPYLATGWLRDLHDEALTGRRDDTAVIKFASTDNPLFGREEFERMRRELPDWKFRMFCLGEFTRPAGAIFDCFEHRENVVRPFAIPQSWPRHIGLDFGETNTAAVFLAEDPATGDLYVYETYHAGGRTVREHVAAITTKLGGELTFAVGGSWSEDEWRRDYLDAGLALARAPIKEVEVGIQRVYRQIKERRLRVFSSCDRLIAEIDSYSRELDHFGEPTDRIRDKSRYHRLDALRYLLSTLRPSADPTSTTYSRISLARPQVA